MVRRVIPLLVLSLMLRVWWLDLDTQEIKRNGLVVTWNCDTQYLVVREDGDPGVLYRLNVGRITRSKWERVND